jgi:superfamily II DNA or RNA helicase
MQTEVESKILRRKESDEEFSLYQAALAWDLIEPIVIESRKDIKSEVKWRSRVEPYFHQVNNLITFCRRLPVTLLADDVGLGKTISAGLIISELAARSRLTSVLVVCPKLLGPQWKEELKAKFDMESTIAIGRELIDAKSLGLGAVITTYQSARMYLDKIPIDRFQMLVLDEAHKLRNLYGVEKPPMVATTFRKVLEQRRFRFVLMLTATPIHNRLWDIYSLVDLLTVARGHKNPFGSESSFARRFIADDKETARHLRPESKEEFRAVVYGYMSRVRRADAKLYFPSRTVLMHRATPTRAELQLINIIAAAIAAMNRLAQISILQALTSSPEALSAQLENMARNRTVPAELAIAVKQVVTAMPLSAKLTALGKLVDQLIQENPIAWRMVVFTGRMQTQTSIQLYLENRGLAVGIINGSTSARNQATIGRFRENPPGFHVLVSTEAGSEGVNLQVANVLVNYDLPWNPMIVEQRIGRVQRLASEHAKVSIYNVILRGTFEESIVGRLMEKLQMASQAIGDIESLLEATGIDDDDETSANSFDEQIRRLVVAALTGKDFESATKQAEASISEAKAIMEKEEGAINEMLGSMDGREYTGPRAPKLKTVAAAMPAKDFVLRSLALLGARLLPIDAGTYACEQNGSREYVRFDEQADASRPSTLYSAGSPAFQALVNRLVATGVHDLHDLDRNAISETAAVAQGYVKTFGGRPVSMKAVEVRRCFDGNATLRVRATVALDSYERLLSIGCDSNEHSIETDRSGLEPLRPLLQDPREAGVRAERVAASAQQDTSISEFVRFYLERREQEIKAAAGDEAKEHKLSEEFTPRLEMTIVALQGRVHRRVRAQVVYVLDGATTPYSDEIVVVPSEHRFTDGPPLRTCMKTGRSVPATALQECEISHSTVLRHLLRKSDASDRYALPEYFCQCSVTGKMLLSDELEKSGITGHLVDRSSIETSEISGKRGEPKFFNRCEFTDSTVLRSELAKSEVSGKHYRVDQKAQSEISGKVGHQSEFIQCAETGKTLLLSESEQCSETKKRVVPGVLQTCDATGARVLPSQLLRCATTGKRALRRLFVASSVSGRDVLETHAVRAVSGKYCLPIEAVTCAWGGQLTHPDDIRICGLTGLSINFEYSVSAGEPRLKVLEELLTGIRHTTDRTELWPQIESVLPASFPKGKCRMDAGTQSPDTKRLALTAVVKAAFGLKVTWVGYVYAIDEGFVIGRIAQGKRNATGWSASQH